MCSQPNSTAGPLTFTNCEGPGQPLHDQEVGYNYTGAGAIPKTGSDGLCMTAGEGGVGLAPCGSNPAGQEWIYTSQQQFVLTSNASMCLSAGPTGPAPLLSNVFGSHMVFQRDAPATLWGWTTPGFSVTVSVSGGGPVVVSAPAGPDGRWNASLPASPASIGGVGVNITVAASDGGATAVLSDVLFGDVVWCSGQSNLSGGNTPVAYAFNATAEIAASAAYPWVRVFTVGTYDGGSPLPLPELSQVGVDGWWGACVLCTARFTPPTAPAHPVVCCWPRIRLGVLGDVLVSRQGPRRRPRAGRAARPRRVCVGRHRDSGAPEGQSTRLTTRTCRRHTSAHCRSSGSPRASMRRATCRTAPRHSGIP